MTIHVNIGEAKARFSELVAAAVNGEQVIVLKAGQAQIRFVAVDDVAAEERSRIAAMRKSAIGMYADAFADSAFDVPPSMTDEDVEERFRRKFGPAL